MPAGTARPSPRVADWVHHHRAYPPRGASGGRVIDPESGLDAVRDVAIAGDRVAAVGPGLPPGRQEVNVDGQVVTRIRRPAQSRA